MADGHAQDKNKSRLKAVEWGQVIPGELKDANGVLADTVFVFIKFQSQANLAAYIDTLQGSTYTSQVMERSDTPISPWRYSCSVYAIPP